MTYATFMHAYRAQCRPRRIGQVVVWLRSLMFAADARDPANDWIVDAYMRATQAVDRSQVQLLSATARFARPD